MDRGRDNPQVRAGQHHHDPFDACQSGEKFSMPGIGKPCPVNQRFLVDRCRAQGRGAALLNQRDAVLDGRDDARCVLRIGLAGRCRGRKVMRQHRQCISRNGGRLRGVIQQDSRCSFRQVARIADPEERHCVAQGRPGFDRQLGADSGRFSTTQRDGLAHFSTITASARNWLSRLSANDASRWLASALDICSREASSASSVVLPHSISRIRF